MIAQRQYATAGALRAALEARLNEKSRRDGVDLQRLRRQVAFDRLLARMFDCSQLDRDGWVLKGRYALEMRIHQARSTKDLDLTVRRSGPRSDESPASLRERLQLAAEVQLPDFLLQSMPLSYAGVRIRFRWTFLALRWTGRSHL